MYSPDDFIKDILRTMDFLKLTERQQAKLAKSISLTGADAPELVSQTFPQRATTNNFASSEIQSRDVDNDPILGMRVLRRFAGFGEFWGIITFRRSPGPGRTWYKVEYDDGDSEEYNLKDIKRMADQAAAKAASDPRGGHHNPHSDDGSSHVSADDRASALHLAIQDEETLNPDMGDSSSSGVIAGVERDNELSSTVGQEGGIGSSSMLDFSLGAPRGLLASSAMIPPLPPPPPPPPSSTTPNGILSSARVSMVEPTKDVYQLRKLEMSLLGMGFPNMAVKDAIAIHGCNHSRCLEFLLGNCSGSNSTEPTQLAPHEVSLPNSGPAVSKFEKDFSDIPKSGRAAKAKAAAAIASCSSPPSQTSWQVAPSSPPAPSPAPLVTAATAATAAKKNARKTTSVTPSSSSSKKSKPGKGAKKSTDSVAQVIIPIPPGSLAIPMSTEEEEEDNNLYPCGKCSDETKASGLLLCDGCDAEVCLKCADVNEIPDESWFCSTCANATFAFNGPLTGSTIGGSIPDVSAPVDREEAAKAVAAAATAAAAAATAYAVTAAATVAAAAAVAAAMAAAAANPPASSTSIVLAAENQGTTKGTGKNKGAVSSKRKAPTPRESKNSQSDSATTKTKIEKNNKKNSKKAKEEEMETGKNKDDHKSNVCRSSSEPTPPLSEIKDEAEQEQDSYATAPTSVDNLENEEHHADQQVEKEVSEQGSSKNAPATPSDLVGVDFENFEWDFNTVVDAATEGAVSKDSSSSLTITTSSSSSSSSGACGDKAARIDDDADEGEAAARVAGLVAALPERVSKTLEGLEALGWVKVNTLEVEVLGALALFVPESKALDMLDKVATAGSKLQGVGGGVGRSPGSLLLNTLVKTYMSLAGNNGNVNSNNGGDGVYGYAKTEGGGTGGGGGSGGGGNARTENQRNRRQGARHGNHGGRGNRGGQKQGREGNGARNDDYRDDFQHTSSHGGGGGSKRSRSPDTNFKGGATPSSNQSSSSSSSSSDRGSSDGGGRSGGGREAKKSWDEGSQRGGGGCQRSSGGDGGGRSDRAAPPSSAASSVLDGGETPANRAIRMQAVLSRLKGLASLTGTSEAPTKHNRSVSSVDSSPRTAPLPPQHPPPPRGQPPPPFVQSRSPPESHLHRDPERNDKYDKYRGTGSSCGGGSGGGGGNLEVFAAPPPPSSVQSRTTPESHLHQDRGKPRQHERIDKYDKYRGTGSSSGGGSGGGGGNLEVFAALPLPPPVQLKTMPESRLHQDRGKPHHNERNDKYDKYKGTGSSSGGGSGGAGGRNLEVFESVEVPNASVGIIIGRGGENIQALTRLTGCRRIRAKETSLNSATRSIILLGSTEAVALAKAEIHRILEGKLPSAARPPGMNETGGLGSGGGYEGTGANFVGGALYPSPPPPRPHPHPPTHPPPPVLVADMVNGFGSGGNSCAQRGDVDSSSGGSGSSDTLSTAQRMERMQAVLGRLQKGGVGQV